MNELIVRPAADPKGWDQFLRRASTPNTVLQSWAWGEFQAATGRPILRFEAMRGQDRVAVCLVAVHTTKIGKPYLLAPRGPVIAEVADAADAGLIWSDLLRAIGQARPDGAMFLKVEPSAVPPDSVNVSASSGIQPETTLLVDLKKSDEELLQAMHPKTRYNVHLAARKGIKVRWSRTSADLDLLLRLLSKTSEHQHIGLHPVSYYRAMVERLGESVEIAVAEQDATPLAAAIMLRFGDTMTYLHGGSDYEQRELMAPYAMQWESIKRARSLGHTTYDFYGIAPDDDPQHKWAGITRFKKGFGGTILKYPSAYNLIYDRRWYMAYKFAKRMAGL